LKILIVFSSSHGTTKKAAQLLTENITGEVDIIDLGKCPKPNLKDYAAVILGGSIHAGSIQSKVKQFIKENQPVLMTKQIGLFLCCMFEGNKAIKQFETAYPQELREKSLANGLFGGEYIISKLNFLERKIVKLVNGVARDVSKIDEQEIKNFADKLSSLS
jgi:Flavodoxin